MDTSQDREIWGDPYVGLRWAAESVEVFQQIAFDTPRFCWDAGHTTLGSPDIWEDIKNFFGSIADFFTSPGGWVRGTAYPWILGAIATIQTYIFDIRDVIADVWNNAWNFVFGPESWLQKTAYPWLQGRLAILQTVLYDIRNDIADLWNNAWGSLFGPTGWIQRTAYPWIIGAIATIQTFIYDIRDVIAEVWNNAWNYVFGPESWLQKTAYPWLQAALASISTFIFDIRDVIAEVWNNAYNQILTFKAWWQEEAKPWIVDLPGRLWASLQAGVSELWAGLTAWWQGIVDWVTEAVDTAIATIGPKVRQWVGDFAALPERFLTHVAETAGTNLALEPSRALGTAGSLYAMAIAAGTAAHVTSTALNAIPALNWVGASQLSAFVAQVAGFDEITKATYGTLLDGALAWPMRYHWNQMLRPKIPTEGAIYATGRKRGINRAEFTQAMGYHGLPQWWIDKEYAFFWADPSPYWLLRMSEHTTPTMQPSALMRGWLAEWLPNWRSDPWAWYRMKLLLAGFEDTDIQPFIDGFQRRRLGPAITRLKTAIRHMSREAYWDDREVTDNLRSLGVRQEEITYLLDAERIQRQNDYLDDQVRYYNESFRKGEISAQGLSIVLSTIIVKPEVVAQIVAREKVRALPKPKAIVPVAEDPRVKSLVTQAVNSWTKGYRKWELEEEELEIGLTIVLQDPALARRMVAVERTRYRPPPPPPPPIKIHPLVVSALRSAVGSWIARYRAWEIDAVVLYNTLVSILEDEPLAREIVVTEEARYREPLPPAPPIEVHPLVVSALRAAVASWIGRYRAWDIDARELEAALIDVLEDVPLAREIVATEEARYRPPVPPPPPIEEDPLVRKARVAAIASWVSQFREGVITAAVMELGLAALIVDPDIVVLIRQIEELRAVPAPDILPPWEEDPLLAAVRQEAVRGHIEMFRKRLIDIDELYAYLLADGLAEPLGRATALTQALKRIKTPPLESPYFQKDRFRALIDEAVASYTRMLELGQVTMDEFRAYLAGIGVDPDVITYLVDTQGVRQFILLEGMG